MAIFVPNGVEQENKYIESVQFLAEQFVENNTSFDHIGGQLKNAVNNNSITVPDTVSNGEKFTDSIQFLSHCISENHTHFEHIMEQISIEIDDQIIGGH